MFAVYGDSNGDGVRMNMRMRVRVRMSVSVRVRVRMIVSVRVRAFSIFRCNGPKLAHEMFPDSFDILRSL